MKKSEFIEIYKGIEIHLTSDKEHPYSTFQKVPVLGTLENGHKTIEGARRFIDKLNIPVS